MAEAVGVVMSNLPQAAGNETTPASPSSGGASEFAKLFENNMKLEEEMNQFIEKSFGVPFSEQVVQNAVPGPTLPVSPEQLVAAPQPTTLVEKISSFLSETNRGQLQMSNLMEVMTSGQKMTPQDLLAAQIGVYQASFELELTGKGFEQGVNSFKTMWNTNFQS